MQNPPEKAWTTAGVGRLAGYSPQQVRDLERLGVLPPAARAANGYRHFGPAHLTALHAYRALAEAIGPVPARRLMPLLVHGTVDEAAQLVDELHADLARERARLTEALRGLESAVIEASDVFDAEDAMTIGELASAVGARPSALRHWEREGLVNPVRGADDGRSYDAAAVTETRIVAALRAGGYGIPAIAAILEPLREHRLTADVRRMLAHRLDGLNRRSIALLAAAGRLHELLADRAEPGTPRLES